MYIELFLHVFAFVSMFCFLHIFAANKERILFLARDVGNPASSDPHFTVVRHKDIYLGQSWASGVNIGTRDQESSSEVKH